MPARTGAAYLQGLRERNTEVWLGHERIRDVTAHPALQRGARSVAHLYDMQHDPTLCDEMTYISPTSGERVGLSARWLEPAGAQPRGLLVAPGALLEPLHSLVV